MTASGGENNDVWIIYSGASCHIALDRKLIVPIDFDAQRQLISTVNGHQSQSKGKGVCKTTSSANLSISNVYFVPGFNSNLLSVRKITEKNYKVSFFEKKMYN